MAKGARERTLGVVGSWRAVLGCYAEESGLELWRKWEVIIEVQLEG